MKPYWDGAAFGWGVGIMAGQTIQFLCRGDLGLAIITLSIGVVYGALSFWWHRRTPMKPNPILNSGCERGAGE